jgi:class 3 adenylate cyclase
VLTGGGFHPGEALDGQDLLAGIQAPADWFAHPADVVGEFRSASGEEMLGAAHPLAAYRLILAARRPKAAVYASMGAARQALYGSALGFAVLALVLGGWLGSRTTRPIRSLVELAGAYGRREFQRRPDVRSGDELQDLGASLGEMASELERSEAELRRREKVEANLSRFLPQGVAHEIATGKQELALGGERRPITVLFADVVSFTTFSEQAPPERVVAFLNELFTVLTEVVFRHGGTVDKFIGDSVMVLFGAPVAQSDQVARALATAEDFQRFVEASAPGWKQRYGIDTQIGIGIHSGEALVGNLGSELRMEYTAIGDVVNTAARLQSMAQPGQTLVSGAVAREAGATFGLVPLGEHAIRGRKQPVMLYALP